jgi:hypothetical protein
MGAKSTPVTILHNRPTTMETLGFRQIVTILHNSTIVLVGMILIVSSTFVLSRMVPILSSIFVLQYACATVQLYCSIFVL